MWLGQAFAALVDGDGDWNRRLLMVIGLGVSLAPISALRFYLSNRFALAVAAGLQRRAFAGALTVESSPIGSSPVGSSATEDSATEDSAAERIIADAAAVRTILAGEALPSLRNLILFLGAMGLMFATSLYLATVALALTLPILVLISLGIAAMRSTAAGWQGMEAGLHARLQERIRRRRIIQAFLREEAEAAEFAELSTTAHRAFFAYLRRRAWLSALVIAAMAVAVGAVFWQGADAVGDGGLERGQLAAFLFYGVLAAVSLSGFTESASAWGRLESALLRLWSPPPKAVKRAGEKLHFRSLEFRRVSFTYPGDGKQTLHEVSFILKRGQAHGLVGQSGSGKSTIFYLILGFFKPDSGKILINGKGWDSLGANAVRGMFGLVPQDSALLSGSIRHNITYGVKPGGEQSAAQIAACLKAVGAEFVAKLPGGIDTEILDKIDLSEGQKQRLAWARALLSGAEVLLLDEATSALDTINEAAIIKNLKRRTCLVIAHRPSTMRAMQKITVVENGRVLASGNHSVLRRRYPLYKHLSSQAFT